MNLTPPDPLPLAHLHKSDQAGSLIIDLRAIADNYALLSEVAGGARCAAVIKANAYGLGMGPVASVLWDSGCRSFFVALPAEGVELRSLLADAEIFILNGIAATPASLFCAHGLIPVLNSLPDIESWRDAGGGNAALQFDTGMTRLGLSEAESDGLSPTSAALAGIDVVLVMSHLACADTPDHPLNRAQLDAFRQIASRFSDCRASLANSSGIFLGSEYHADLARPGAALFGISPRPDTPNPMSQVIELKGTILQLREIDTPRSVGYGASQSVRPHTILATVAIGYADGYSRALSGRGKAFVGDDEVTLVGRVSMDLATFDVSDVPASNIVVGGELTLIGPGYTLDEMATDAGTIGYEILTGLGPRLSRHYLAVDRL